MRVPVRAVRVPKGRLVDHRLVLGGTEGAVGVRHGTVELRVGCVVAGREGRKAVINDSTVSTILVTTRQRARHVSSLQQRS